jgi:hypothetical protein
VVNLKRKETQMGAEKWWWLPGALLALTGVLFCVGSIWGNPGVFVSIGVVFFIIAGINLRRRAPR